MAKSAAVLLGAAALASIALPAAAQCCRLGSEVMDVRAGSYRDAAPQDDGYAEPARSGWSYSHSGYADRDSTVSRYREYHSYHSATYIGWAGKTVVDDGGYDARDDRYGGEVVEGGHGCPPAMDGERVIRCRYIPFERQAAPAPDEVSSLDLYTDGGVGGFVSGGGGGGGGGGGVFIEGSGLSGAFTHSSATSRAYASSSASASASAAVAISIQAQMHGGGHGGGGWSGGGWSSGGHSSGGGGRW